MLLSYLLVSDLDENRRGGDLGELRASPFVDCRVCVQEERVDLESAFVDSREDVRAERIFE